MNLWAISTKEPFAGYTLRRLGEEAPALGIDLRVFKPGELQALIDENGSRIMFEGASLGPPDALLVRTGASTITWQTLALMRLLELAGHTRVINSHATFLRAKDKFSTLLHLAGHGIGLPKTQLVSDLLVSNPASLLALSKEFGFPVVVKEVGGARGNSVMFCNAPADLDETLQMLFTVRRPTAEFIVQECVRSSLGHDVRVYVVGKQILGAIERQAKRDARKANVAQGAEVRQVVVTDDMARMVRKVQEALGLEIGGVDLLYADVGFKVCEVNLSAQFEGFEKATGVNVAEAILRYCLQAGVAEPGGKSSSACPPAKTQA